MQNPPRDIYSLVAGGPDHPGKTSQFIEFEVRSFGSDSVSDRFQYSSKTGEARSLGSALVEHVHESFCDLRYIIVPNSPRTAIGRTGTMGLQLILPM